MQTINLNKYPISQKILPEDLREFRSKIFPFYLRAGRLMFNFR